MLAHGSKVVQGYDVMEELYNAKTAAINFVHEVCKVRAKGNLEDFMGICVGVMNEYKVCHFLLRRLQIADTYKILCILFSTKLLSACVMMTQHLLQAAGASATKEQSRRVDGAFLAVGALNDVLRTTVSSQAAHLCPC